MPCPEVVLLVEGDFDAKIVKSLFTAANFPLNKIEIHCAKGKHNIKKLYYELSFNSRKKFAVLVDLDYHSNFEPEEMARNDLHLDEAVSVFCAVPTIEAWLFADIDAARKKVRNKKRGEELLNRIPLPDEIPYPRHLAQNLFTLNEKFEMMACDIDLNVATSRSPSLRKFIEGIGNLLGLEVMPLLGKCFERSVGRDLFCNLLDEVAPPDAIIYKTLDGKQITANEMVRNVREGTELGYQYSSDLLRVARDFIAREARRGDRK
ncbi:DUF4276 family protein [Geomonas subterranea]|uniref:DUF4276 family protein n=1 Tax=Geomonas subterranea TaxID=2847989 RepID=A0ABX8LPN1_9BACT|nr:DUF4276 family protein [Geomonas subterranea]QXE92549.1 DUF4276 family protein [Geomonas subterranea]QXM09353.1 DUF4276 family protein [Geomonas subterranea]